MRQTIFALCLLLVVVSCKNETKTEEKGTPKTEAQTNALDYFKGEFVYYNGAAVLQTSSEIYGVLLSDKLEELQALAEKYKNEPTDMVEVEIKGTVTTQKHETILWDKKIEVVEILAVSPSTNKENSTVKLGS